MMQSAQNELINKLDSFIRKYYQNELVKGGILAVAISVALLLAVSFLEFIGRFGTSVRAVLFFSALALLFAVVYRYVLIPLLQLYRIGKVISHDQAAIIIGKHFPIVEDKLLNVLQLQRATEGNQALILAGIAQKSKQLSPIPFQNAIDFSRTKSYLKYAIGPVFLLLLLIITDNASFLSESTMRIVDYKTEYLPVAPFEFRVNEEDLQALQGEDFRLTVWISGDELPEKVFADIRGNKYKLEQLSKTEFRFTFRNLQQSEKFRLSAGGFSSAEFELKVLPNPMLLGFTVQVVYPKYTGIEAREYNNIGDMRVPVGSTIKWKFNTRNTDQLSLIFGDSAFAPNRDGETVFTYERRVNSDLQYFVTTRNKFVEGKDTTRFYLQAIPDAYPTLRIEEMQDSSYAKIFYFSGLADDDYGFTKLTFNYRKNNEQASSYVKKEIALNRSSNKEQFFYYWDASQIQLQKGEAVEYFFELWDNDGVAGPKSTRSQTRLFRAPTDEELKQMDEEASKQIEKNLEEALFAARDLQKEMEKMRAEMLQKKELTWEDKKKMEELLAKQKELQTTIQQMAEENKKNNARQNEYNEQNERILQKQQMLEKMLNEMMSDELRKMLEEMEKMMNELDKEKLQKYLEEMKLSNEELEKELDRNLELFKQLEFEEKLQETIDNLKELQQEQEKLAQETEIGEKSAEELKQMQDELNKKFDEIKDDLKELKEKNENLESPNDLPDTDQLEKQIEQEMDKGSENLQKNRKKEASKNQKNAAEKMEEMSQKMESAQEAMGMEGQMENMEDLRQLLDNLIFLSMEQERIMMELANTASTDPMFTEYIRQQSKVREDAKMIEDSLLSLSKRIFEIEPYVNKEMGLINYHLKSATYSLEQRDKKKAQNDQQFVMTSANNLALILNEILKQMQQQMANQMQGQQSCQKPGSGNPSMSEMKKMQQQMADDMKKMKGKMENGEMPGDKKGQKGGGGGGMSKEFAQMAARQEALRQQLKEMAEQMGPGKDGKQPLGDIMQKMEEIETDLLNKTITAETLKRQEEILSRLLEEERAEQEREQDDKRESKEAAQNMAITPPSFEQYQRMKEKQAELLKTMPPSLSGFYKNLAGSYFNALLVD